MQRRQSKQTTDWRVLFESSRCRPSPRDSVHIPMDIDGRGMYPKATILGLDIEPCTPIKLARAMENSPSLSYCQSQGAKYRVAEQISNLRPIILWEKAPGGYCIRIATPWNATSARSLNQKQWP